MSANYPDDSDEYAHNDSSLWDDSGSMQPTRNDDIVKENVVENDKSADFGGHYLRRQLEKMPDCAEKSLIALICLVQDFLDRKQDSASAEMLRDLQIEYRSLEEKLQREYTTDELRAEEVRKCLDAIECLAPNMTSSSSADQWKTLVDKFKSLLVQLRPFDFEMLFSLFEETAAVQREIEGKDIILLVGKTGSGKSTTLHYLAGSRMIKKGNSIVVDPAELQRMSLDLKKVTISASPNSETKFLTPVLVDLCKLAKIDGTIYLCDTPGFDDTTGAEVDVANAYGMIEAVRKCKSVRVVPVINYDDLSGRLDGVINMAHLLLGMLKETDQVIDSVTFLFSKFPKEYDIKDMLEKVLKREGLGTDIRNIIIQMADRKEVLTVQPLDTADAPKLLRSINRIVPITNPNETFKNFCTDKSIEKMKTQLGKQDRAIQSALRRRDYALVGFKLGQLKRLCGYLGSIAWLEDDYRSLVSQVADSFEKLFQTSRNAFGKQLGNRNRITQDDAEAYKAAMATFREIKSIVNDHFESGKQTDYEHYLNEHLIQTAKWIGDELLKVPSDKDTRIRLLENMHMLFDNFADSVKPVYEEMYREMTKKLADSSTRFKLRSDPFAFDAIVEELQTIKRLEKIVDACTQRQNGSFNREYESCTNHVFKLITKKAEGLFENYERPEFYDSVNDFVTKLDEAIANSEFGYFIDAVKLKEFKHLIRDRLSDKLRSLTDAIKGVAATDEDSLGSLKKLYEEVLKLDSIPLFAPNSQGAFRECQEHISLVAFNIKFKIRDAFEAVKTGQRETEELTTIKMYLHMMKNADWLNQVSPNLHTSSVRDYEAELVKNAGEIYRNVTALYIDLKSSTNLRAALKWYNQLTLMKPLAACDPKSAECVTKAMKHVEDQFTEVFDSMRKTFNLNELSLSAKRERLEQLKADADRTEDEFGKQEHQREIRELESLIASMEKKQSKYSFPRLNGSFFDNSIKYLEEIITHPSKLYRDEATKYQEMLNAYLIEYSRSIEDEFRANLRLIGQLHDNKISEDEARQYVQAMIYSLKDLTSLQSHHHSVYKKLSYEANTGLIEHLNEILNDHAMSLEEKLKHVQQDSGSSMLEMYLPGVQILGYLDAHRLEGPTLRKFSVIYEFFSNQKFEDAKDCILNVIRNLEIYNYRNVVYDLTAIDGIKINASSLRQMSHAVRMSVQNVIDLVRSLERRITRDLNPEPAESLAEQMRLLKMAESDLFSLRKGAHESSNIAKVLSLETKEEIDKTLRDIRARLNVKFQTILSNIEKSIDEKDFERAETSRDKYEQVFVFLGDFADGHEALKAKFDEIEQKFENYLTGIAAGYANMPVTDYQVKCPKNLVEKLNKVAKVKIRYQNAVTDINDSIFRSMRLFIQGQEPTNADGSASTLSPLDRFEVAESLLWYLPEEVERVLREEITRRKNNFNQIQKNKIDELKQLIDQNDIEMVSSFFANTKELDSISYYAHKELAVKVQQIGWQICSELNDDQALEKVRSKIVLVHNYYKRFHDKVNSVEITHNRVQEALKKRLASVCKELANFVANPKSTKPAVVEKKFDDFVVIVQLVEEKALTVEPDMIANQVAKLVEFFKINYGRFGQALVECNVEKALKALRNSQKWDELLKRIGTMPHDSCVGLKVEELSFSKMKKEIKEKLTELAAEVEAVNVDDLAKFKHMHERDAIFKSIADKFKFFKGLETGSSSDERLALARLINPTLEQIKKGLELIGANISSNLKTMIGHRTIARREFKTLGHRYGLLVSFENLFEKIVPGACGDAKSQLLARCDALASDAIKAKADVDVAVQCFIGLKCYADHLDSLRKEIETILIGALEEYKKFLKSERMKLSKLSDILERDEVGITIVSSFEIFKGENIKALNEKTNQHGIDYVLAKIDGDSIDTVKLKSRYETYKSVNDELIRKYINEENYPELIKEGIDAIKNVMDRVAAWNETLTNQFPALVAHIAALWTLKNKKYYTESGEVNTNSPYLLRLHAAQVVAIFRLLRMGFTAVGSSGVIDRNVLNNTLAQVGTGEGKSVILAIVSCILALRKFEVYCACYSEYLSNRDYKDFKDIFDILGVTKFIHYGTFNKVCERILNEKVDIRESVVEMVKSNKLSDKSKLLIDRLRILIIDEVDVFFSRDFLGKLYVPTAQLKDSAISDLLDFLWNSRDRHLNPWNVKESKEYEACKNKFSNWIELIDGAIVEALSDLRDFKTHDYVVSDDKIAYQEHDGLSFNTVCGYKTLWAYYAEDEKGRVSQKNLNENKSIGIYTGCYSYSEISCLESKTFASTLGVSGTLKTLNETQRDFIKSNYGIQSFTYMPSVYGDSKCLFAREADTMVHNRDDFNIRLREEIDRRLKSTNNSNVERAVLVFFDGKKSLMSFYNSDQVRSIWDSVNIIIEETTPQDKEKFIRDAVKSGQITFMTRSFGRGIDFICRNQTLLANGGVHVIQTFLSEDLSEEVQIRGRTARQGETGSYSMVLVDEELEIYLGTDYKAKIETMRNQNQIYQTLNDARNAYFAAANMAIFAAVESVKNDHDTSTKFRINLIDGKLDEIKKFLLEHSTRVNVTEKSRTLCLMDATGSMTNLLTNAKNTVFTVFERIRAILAAKSIPEDSFELEFAVYRDYDNRELILQASGWQSNPLHLRQFMDTVQPIGNSTGNEAVEIGLWHANRQASSSGLAQVLLIGDAPAKPDKQIKHDRSRFGGESFWEPRFGPMTNYQKEVEKLKQAGVPVYTYSLDEYCFQNFSDISERTGGEWKYLDVNSGNVPEELIDSVSLRVLKDLGKRNGDVDLVSDYIRKYPKTYK